MQFWYVYVLRSAKDEMFYIGSTNNLRRRLLQHQGGNNTSTAKRLPIELVYFEGHLSKDDAIRREKYFKTTKGKVTLRSPMNNFLHSLPQIAYCEERSGVFIAQPVNWN
jgi:putative endonuclease